MNEVTMYLIRRKSDGKYWKNLTTTMYYHEQMLNKKDPGWTDDRGECRFFKTASGAKSCRIWYGRKTVPIGTRNCLYCKEKNRTDYWHSSCVDWKSVKLTEDEMPYEVIPVVMSYK